MAGLRFRPHAGDAATTGDEEAQPQPPGTLATGAIRADTQAPINNENQDNSTNNQNNAGNSNALYKLLGEAADDNEAMRELSSRWDFLKTEVNVPSPNDENKTPLHLAAEKGFKSVVKKLLEEAAADPSLGDEDGWRPLHFACSAGHTTVMDELISHNADPEVTERFGRNLLHIAGIYGQIAAFNHIAERYIQLLERTTTKSRMTPLHSAVYWGSEQMVNVCLNSGADIYAKDSDGQTTLMMAAYTKDKDKMDILMKRLKSADSDLTVHINACNNEGKTPLMVACERGWAQGVEVLGQAGADYNSRDQLGRLALHYSILCGDLSIIEKITKETDPKNLLMTDDNGLSAFDNFDFNQATNQVTQLESITNHVFACITSEYSQREMLEWAAKGTKRSKIFRMLVERLTSKHIFDNIDTNDLSAFELAVHSRLPWALWILIDNFPSTSETLAPVQKAQELAKELLPPEIKSKKPELNDYGTQQEMSRSNKEDAILYDMQNYLHDFAVAENYKRNLSKPVKQREGLDEVLPEFKATITQFFDGQSQSSQRRTRWIKQWRSIENVIYGKGPVKVADDMMKTWFPYPKTELKTGPQNSGLPKQDTEIQTRLKWIHLPVTNMVWMEDLVRRIVNERNLSANQTQSIASFLRRSWVQVPDRTSASRFMRPLYVSKFKDELDLLDDTITDRPSGTDKDANKDANSKTDIKNVTGQEQSNPIGISAAYLPYLSMSTWTPSTISVLNKRDRLYKNLLDVYKDDAIHQSATLDESYYHFWSDKASKADQEERNKSQVVTKYLMGGTGEEVEDGDPYRVYTVVRVKQLWVWTILDEWVITATPHAVDELQEDDLPKDFLSHPDIHEQITEASSKPGFAARVATLITNYCVDTYERKRSSEQVDASQDSDSSSSNSHDVKEELATRSIRQLFSDIVNENAREEKRLFSDCHSLTQSRKKGNDDKLKSILTQASKLACDIKDLRDELNMLRSIVNSQLTVQNEMPGNTNGSSSITGQYFSKDLEELENVAKRTQESVDTILTLAETEIANDQARQATRQGRTMMVFTVVTILFLPLSFLSSLFALSDKPFEQTPSWIHVIIWTVSFTFFVPVASIALFSDAAAKQWNRIWGPMEQIVTKHWCDFQEKQENKKELKESKKEEAEKKKKEEAWRKENDRLRKKEDELNRKREELMNNRPDISPV
ncbi:unnamed protein product [Fusarium graminearum]|uniref:Chromosome 1, complete genome n=1 Tax=Gibberella zeae (strain ATCC MYA-4620 / CBS 123657 / FGSC 9075 / NRRL 31084 / PH-1) TaxID=229533 RepID=A0A098D0L7_GIBZE|nr:unnamed protein product [Fusarium graminearum]